MRSPSDFYPHQPIIRDFIKQKADPGCACWVPMGGSKTVCSLTAFDDLQQSFSARHALVVAPLRVARKVWSDEIDEWSHLRGLTVAKIIGTEKQRLEALSRRADIHTINRENVSWLHDQYIQGKKQVRTWPWDTVFLDESQSFKSQSSKRWKALRRLRRLFPRLVQLTGTPIPNGYRDLWAQMYLLDGGTRLGATESAYLNRWFHEIRGDGYSNWVLKSGAKEEIHALIADIVLSIRLEDYFDVGVPTFNPVRVALDPKDLGTYRKFEREYIAEFNGTKVTAVSAGVLGNKLLQLANGSIYVNDDGDYELFHNEKIDALTELLDGLDGPVILAYAFRADAERIALALQDYCKKVGKKWCFANTDEDLNNFANGSVDYIAMHPASAGHGLNDMYKSGATNIVWFGLTANLEWFQQLNARLAGGLRMLGRVVTIHLILADETRDMQMKDLLTDKEVTQEGLTRALSAISRGETNKILVSHAVNDALAIAFG
jgi:hypothetical protein